MNTKKKRVLPGTLFLPITYTLLLCFPASLLTYLPASLAAYASSFLNQSKKTACLKMNFARFFSYFRLKSIVASWKRGPHACKKSSVFLFQALIPPKNKEAHGRFNLAELHFLYKRWKILQNSSCRAAITKKVEKAKKTVCRVPEVSRAGHPLPSFL